MLNKCVPSSKIINLLKKWKYIFLEKMELEQLLLTWFNFNFIMDM